MSRDPGRVDSSRPSDEEEDAPARSEGEGRTTSSGPSGRERASSSTSRRSAELRRASRRRRSLVHPGRWRELVTRPWFEPVLTLVALAALLGGLFAYSGTWPPLVVVESSSMQHGTQDVLGVINTGDLVVVKHVDVPSQVTTYVQGEGEDPTYSTYGEFGDVLLYFPDGNTAYTPVIHRALIWLTWDASAQAFEAPSLANLACGPRSNGVYEIQTSQSSFECLSPSAPNMPLTGTIVLWNVGWQGVTVQISLPALAQQAPPHSGFITEGDDNCALPSGGSDAVCSPGDTGVYDQHACAITCAVVEPQWVEGVARGMIPWFGAIKLWLSGNGADVPSNTGVYLGLTILAILLLPTVLPWLVRRLRKGGTRDRPEGSATSAGTQPPEDEREEDVEAQSIEDGGTEGRPSEPSPAD